jgi:hypothetical protein
MTTRIILGVDVGICGGLAVVAIETSLTGPAVVEAKPAAEPVETKKPAATTVDAALDQFAGKTVEPPTLREELKDEIPW